MAKLTKALLSGLALNLVMASVVPNARSQAVPTPQVAGSGITVTLNGVSAAVPTKGETQQLNVSQGQRTSLSVGNGVTLGTSAQFTSSVGTVSLARSVLEPTSVFLKSSIGDNLPTSENPTGQITKIHIENITANSNGGQIRSDGGSEMDIDEDSKFASGKADIIGMVSSSEIVVDRAMGGVAEYYATSNPQVLEGADPFFRDMVVDEDGNVSYTGNILTKDGSTGNLNDPDGDGAETGRPMMRGSDDTDADYWDSVGACVPTASNGCIYEKADILKTGNANANSSYQTSTNIDINSNAFTNVFGQAF